MVYQRQPNFRFSKGGASKLCKWNPYGVLGVVEEHAEELLHIATQAEYNVEARQFLVQRHNGIRNAYLELAAKYHPDGDRLPPNATTWVTAEDHFTAISTAYRTLTDVTLTLEYLVAAEMQEQDDDIASLACSDVSSNQLLGQAHHASRDLQQSLGCTCRRAGSTRIR